METVLKLRKIFKYIYIICMKFQRNAKINVGKNVQKHCERRLMRPSTNSYYLVRHKFLVKFQIYEKEKSLPGPKIF